MSIVYEWNISNLECVPHEGDYANIVKVIHWVRTAASDGYNASSYGSVTIPAPQGSFIPYEDLTQAEVDGWLNDCVNVASVDAALATQIEQLKNPPVVSLPLPWSQQV
jgi:hypothetical protein